MERLQANPLPWLLEPDPANPGVRYYALRDLLGLPEDDAEVLQARAEVMAAGPVPVILAAQEPEGYWAKPGAGYSPKYKGTVWQIIFLAKLGADPDDERVRRGCEYVLSHSQAANGGFSFNQSRAASGVAHCLNGNLLSALLTLGYAGDPSVQAALDWQVQAIAGEGAIRYYQSGTSGPGFACGINLGQPCGWGAVKAMKALCAVPPDLRNPALQRAIQAGVDFLLSRDPAAADYPYTLRVSSTWFQFGFPPSYWSDVLEILEVLAGAGIGADPRLAHAIDLVLSKQDDQSRWKLANSLNGKMWVDLEAKGKPSKWVTLRALRVLKRCSVIECY